MTIINILLLLLLLLLINTIGRGEKYTSNINYHSNINSKNGHTIRHEHTAIFFHTHYHIIREQRLGCSAKDTRQPQSIFKKAEILTSWWQIHLHINCNFNARATPSLQARVPQPLTQNRWGKAW